MGSFRCYYSIPHFPLCIDEACQLSLCGVNGRYINSRRIKRGTGPVRYTGWTVPTYNQSQQQYGYTPNQNAYGMNNYPPGQYPPGQQPQYSYQGQQQYGNQAPPVQSDGPAYYDATQNGGQGTCPRCVSELIV